MMQVSATPEAIAIRAGEAPLKATANWTVVRNRYRAPTPDEARAIENTDAQVVRDDGLLFILDPLAKTLTIKTLKQLGLERKPYEIL